MTRSWLKLLSIALLVCSLLGLQAFQFAGKATLSAQTLSVQDNPLSQPDAEDRSLPDIEDSGAFWSHPVAAEVSLSAVRVRYFIESLILPPPIPSVSLRPPILDR